MRPRRWTPRRLSSSPGRANCGPRRLLSARWPRRSSSRAVALELMADADAAVAAAEGAYEAHGHAGSDAVKRATEARQQFEAVAGWPGAGARDSGAGCRARGPGWPHDVGRARRRMGTRQACRRAADPRWRLRGGAAGPSPEGRGQGPARRSRRPVSTTRRTPTSARPSGSGVSFSAGRSWCWPQRTAWHRRSAGPSVSACRLLAEMMADLLGATPPGAAARVRTRTEKEAREAMAQVGSMGVAGGATCRPPVTARSSPRRAEICRASGVTGFAETPAASARAAALTRPGACQRIKTGLKRKDGACQTCPRQMSADGPPCSKCGQVTGNRVVIYGRDQAGALVPRAAQCRGSPRPAEGVNAFADELESAGGSGRTTRPSSAPEWTYPGSDRTSWWPTGRT